jgi:hypothetical protein
MMDYWMMKERKEEYGRESERQTTKQSHQKGCSGSKLPFWERSAFDLFVTLGAFPSLFYS